LRTRALLLPMQPANLFRQHRLLDGRTVTIRPIRPDDAEREQAFLAGLSGESLYLRFQRWVSAPFEELIHFLTQVDLERHLALVCTAPSDRGEQVVGEARYVVNSGGDSCEFGVVIADAWQKSGIAGLLMDALIAAARARGLRRVEGLVLTSNFAMLRFARGLGFETSIIPDDPTITRIVKQL
jgi:acetyltransferase